MNDELADAITKAILEITGGTAIEFPQTVDQGDPATRKQIAKFISEHPERYKVCCGCEAIVKEHTAVCPQCLAYRFEDDKQLVIDHARKLAKRVPTEWIT